MAGEPHTCTCDHTPGVDGCAAVAFRSECRFEVALRDPVNEQVAAAMLVLGEDSATLVRTALLAAGKVVTERPPCAGCGRPLGTGSLLDYKPTPPDVAGLELSASQLAVLTQMGEAPKPWTMKLPLGIWQDFAKDYRCPACAEADPR